MVVDLKLDEKNSDLLTRPNGKKIPWALDKKGYVFYSKWRNHRTEQVLLHRLVAARMVAPKNLSSKDRVRFRDGDKTNCLESNLAILNYSQDAHFRKKRQHTTSKYKGVYFWKARNKYRAKIAYRNKQGKIIHKSLGMFATEDEAYQAYQEAERIYYPDAILPDRNRSKSK